MISGRPPFRASTTLAVLKRVTEDTPRPIQEIIPEVPDWLCTIISRLHSKRAEDRYQTASEVADLLTRCQSELQHAGKVTCVQSSRSRETSDAPDRSRSRETSEATQGSRSRETSDRTLTSPATSTDPHAPIHSHRSRWLLSAAVLSAAALITFFIINRNKNNEPAPLPSNGRQSSEPVAEISNLKSQIRNLKFRTLTPTAAPPSMCCRSAAPSTSSCEKRMLPLSQLGPEIGRRGQPH